MWFLVRLFGLWAAIGVVSAVVAVVLEVLLPLNILVVTLLSIPVGAAAVLWSLLSGAAEERSVVAAELEL